MMRILYIERDYARYGYLKKKYKNLRSYLYHFDQDGYLEHALSVAAETTRLTYADAKVLLPKKKFDAVVVNMKAYNVKGDTHLMARIYSEMLNTVTIPKACFIGSAEADFILPDKVLNNFDIIFKREPFKNRDRYDISDDNKAKIVPTMIHCPFVQGPRDNWLSQAYHLLRLKVKPCLPDEAVYDVGFSGADAAEHNLRRDVWQRVVDEGFSRIGGLQPNPVTKASLPEALQGPRYKGHVYRNALCAAKINLALDGIGQYTFRHQELLYLGCFMMSGPSIRELELPMPLEEGKHYVAFDDMDDMTEKIRYYLAHEGERQQIAAAGKQLFDEYYNPARHGAEILAALKKVQR